MLPIETLAAALYSALLRDLPAAVDASALGTKGALSSHLRRPYESEVECLMFPQTWGSTAMGYGGIGGAAMTTAYTVVISNLHGCKCVYFGCGRLAYRVGGGDQSQSPKGHERWAQDIAAHALVPVTLAGIYL